jgi:hypothetical protein
VILSQRHKIRLLLNLKVKFLRYWPKQIGPANEASGSREARAGKYREVILSQVFEKF